jgi:hypothetical protein
MLATKTVAFHSSLVPLVSKIKKNNKLFTKEQRAWQINIKIVPGYS